MARSLWLRAALNAVKVSVGQRRLASVGFWQGGTPAFAMERQHIDQAGKRKVRPQQGEWKGISTDRTVLVPEPPEAIRTVGQPSIYTQRRTRAARRLPTF